MTIFLIAATTMLAVALSFILPSLLKETSSSHIDHGDYIQCDKLNLAVLRDQLRELDADLQAGSIDTTNYHSARQELERRVAEDVLSSNGITNTLSAQTSPRQGWSAFVVALSIPIIAGSLYFISVHQRR